MIQASLVLERSGHLQVPEDMDGEIYGEAVAKSWTALAAMTKSLGVVPLSAFVREDADDLELMAEETGLDVSDRIAKAKAGGWHGPAECLKTVDALLAHIGQFAGQRIEAEFLKRKIRIEQQWIDWDLRVMKRLLEQAIAGGEGVYVEMGY